MQAQLSLDLDPDRPPPYRQRGTNVLQTIFKQHFQEFADTYEQDYAPTFGRFRLERITEVVENFISCGDYAEGVARIQCTNPECREEFFRRGRRALSVAKASISAPGRAAFLFPETNPAFRRVRGE